MNFLGSYNSDCCVFLQLMIQRGREKGPAGKSKKAGENTHGISQ